MRARSLSKWFKFVAGEPRHWVSTVEFSCVIACKNVRMVGDVVETDIRLLI